MPELISVIVTTYNREDALDAVLRSLARQSDAHFEVLVADDGSRPATTAVVSGWQQRLHVPLWHVWHEHRGFRAAEIRNRAILASRGAYVVCLDGDCLARRDFIAAHRRLAERGWFVSGNRILMSQRLTESVLRERRAVEDWSLSAWLGEFRRGGVNRMLPMLRLPLSGARKWRPQAWRSARSCNLALWRSDLDRIDGFDAAYQGWGREDSDLVIRLIRSGVRHKDGRFATGVLHLWHPEHDRSQLPVNENKLDAVLRGAAVRAERGLSELAADLSTPDRAGASR